MPGRVELIAEIGSVHDGSFGNALKLMDAAHGAGADTVKFQTHIAQAETLRHAPSPPYFADEPRFAYFQRTEFSQEQWDRLAQHAHALGLRFVSSPFALEAVDILESAGVDAYKIASGEVTNLPLLRRIAATGKPVLLSSGMSTWAELDAAVTTLHDCASVTLYQCSSMYPCPPEHVGLNVIAEMGQRYGLPLGFSDHTQGIAAAVAAATLGVVSVEKHFTFSRLMYGSDASLAAEPAEFRLLADALRDVGAMLDNPVDKDDVTPYRDMKATFEKSIVTAIPVRVDEVLTMAHLAFKKPGSGISPSRLDTVLGKRARFDLEPDHLLREEDLR